MQSINCETVIILNKEARHCGLCGKLGHNRRSCPTASQVKIEVTINSLPSQSKEAITYWKPDMFSGGGLISLPSLVAWQPGTDSLAFHSQMKSLPYYTYDSSVKAYRKV